MAAIREKDACIQLLQGPPEALKDKVDILARQKEQLRHRLLTQNNEQYSTADGTGPYLANVWMAAQQNEPGVNTNTSYLAQHQMLTGGGGANIAVGTSATSTSGLINAPGGQILMNGSAPPPQQQQHQQQQLQGGLTMSNSAGVGLPRQHHFQQPPYSSYVSTAGQVQNTNAGTATLGRAGLGAAAAARPVAGK